MLTFLARKAAQHPLGAVGLKILAPVRTAEAWGGGREGLSTFLLFLRAAKSQALYSRKSLNISIPAPLTFDHEAFASACPDVPMCHPALPADTHNDTASKGSLCPATSSATNENAFKAIQQLFPAMLFAAAPQPASPARICFRAKSPSMCWPLPGRKVLSTCRRMLGFWGSCLAAFFSAQSREVMSKVLFPYSPIHTDPVYKHLLISGSEAEGVEALNASVVWFGGDLGWFGVLF